MNFIAKCLLAVVLFIATAGAASACNACGGAAIGGGSSLLEQSSSNLIGIGFGHQGFKQDLHDRSVTDNFNQVTLWGKVKLLNDVFLKINIPYGINNRNDGENKHSLKGLGDLRISAEYIIINSFENNEMNIKNRLAIGSGIKAPSGKNAILEDGWIIPTNFNIGTGSWDFLFNTNYTITGGEAGANIDLNYRLTTKNESRIKSGNQLTADVFGFYKLTAGKVTLIPFAGAYAESVGENKINEFPEYGTGGFGLFSKTGAEVYLNNVGCSAQYKIPLINYYGDNATIATPRVDFNLFYKF